MHNHIVLHGKFHYNYDMEAPQKEIPKVVMPTLNGSIDAITL